MDVRLARLSHAFQQAKPGLAGGGDGNGGVDGVSGRHEPDVGFAGIFQLRGWRRFADKVVGKNLRLNGFRGNDRKDVGIDGVGRDRGRQYVWLDAFGSFDSFSSFNSFNSFSTSQLHRLQQLH